MKAKLFILLMMIAAGSFASELEVRLKDYSSFTVAFNKNYFGAPQSSFALGNIKAGYHFLEVYRVSPYGGTVPVYKGQIFIPENSRVKAVVDKHHRLKVKTEPIYHDHCAESSYTPYVPQPPAPPAYIGMHPETYTGLKSTLMNLTFSSTMLETAKQAISTNGISSKQLAGLMSVFTFENDKLELAKFAYQHVADKRNFFFVNDAFTFSSSIDELNRFLSHYN